MVAHIHTVAIQGIETLDIDVQVATANGLPAFTVVGLPDKAVGESRERVRAAIAAIGLSLPPKRITVNLAPADVLKEGSHFDLPIALGLLMALEILPVEELSGYIALGELGLDGAILPVAGVLPAALAANAHGKGLICPAATAREAAWAGGGLDILPARTLLSIVNHFKGSQLIAQPGDLLAQMEAGGSETAKGNWGSKIGLTDSREGPAAFAHHPDLADIKGQESAKRALEVAAAGGHNMLMCGPPGAGKSMLAQRLPGLLPPMGAQEALEATLVHSVAGLLSDGSLVTNRPFRDPHHSASVPALVGGGVRARPGEISLAHNGVLFLDELPEFNRTALEALRQPMESGRAVIARANAHIGYPARFQLVAAMNPCRCGYLDDAERSCSRAPRCAGEYQNRLSGPLLDRLDIAIDVAGVSASDLALPPPAEGTREVAARVASAREIQAERYRGMTTGISGAIGKGEGERPVRTNADADGRLLEEVAAPDEDGRRLLVEAAERMRLSARGYHRILRVARTLADLEACPNVARVHIAEALSYRARLPGR